MIDIPYHITVDAQFAADYANACNTDPARGRYVGAYAFTARIQRYIDNLSWSSRQRIREDATALEEFGALVKILHNTRRAYIAASVHPGVKSALHTFGRPKDWHLLALEMPQVATDGTRVAYYRNEQKMDAHFSDREGNKHLTATTLTKYLTRHWPHVSSDKIRDIAALQVGHYRWATTMEAMLDVIMDTTADSCMVGHDREDHPYQVYDPKYGWKIAYAVQGTEIVGRALVNDVSKTFVRTYSAFASEHAGLHAFLESEGYAYEDQWQEGLKFAKIPTDDNHLAPYLDPGQNRIASSDCRRVRDAGDCFIRDDEGSWMWDNTDGTPDRVNEYTCEDCGEGCDEITSVGFYQDTCVCENCLENYTYAIGRRGESYYTTEDTVYVNGDNYVIEYASENDLVELYDGDYAKNDDAVYVEDDEAYYPVTEIARNPQRRGQVVYVESESGYYLRDNCEWCVYQEEWILEDEAVEVADGNFVHEESFEDYILSLERDEVAENAVGREAEMLAKWDEANGSDDDEAPATEENPAFILAA